MSTPAPDEKCPELLGPIEVALGVFLLIGTVISYLPQHVKLFMKKSHVGLSLETANFGLTVSWAQLSNYVAIQYYQTFNCCTEEVSALDCFGTNWLPFLQLITIWACSALIAIMYVYYFDRQWLAENGHDVEKEWKRTKFISWLDVWAHILFFVVFLIIALVAGIYSEDIKTFGKICAGLSSVGLIIQWGPQIYSTYKLKRIGSLSIPMLILQAGGVFLTAYFFSLSADNWWVVLPFFVSGTMLSILSVIAIYYYRQEVKLAKEKSPLLNDPENSDSAVFSPKHLYSEPSGLKSNESINNQ